MNVQRYEITHEDGTVERGEWPMHDDLIADLSSAERAVVLEQLEREPGLTIERARARVLDARQKQAVGPVNRKQRRALARAL